MTEYEDTRIDPVMVIGCGAMGRAMAERLHKAGVTVFVHDTDEQRLAGLSKGIECLREPAAPAEVHHFLLSLPGPQAISRVLDVDKGVPSRCAPESLFVDASTSDPHQTRVLGAALQRRGHRLVDAPVSGGRAGALDGALTFYIGGDERDVAEVSTLFSILGQSQIHVGPIGSGHVAKLANNLLCAGNLWLIREVAGMAQQEGLSLEQLVGALNGGSGRSAVSEINLPRWVLSQTYDSGFTTSLMRKDLQLATQLASADGVSLALAEHLLALWRAATQELGEARDFNEIVAPDPNHRTNGLSHED